jgi:hypothetical protein
MPQSPANNRAAERRRALNVTMAEIAREHGLERPLELACECGQPQCWETYALAGDEYDALLQAGLAVLAPGHRVAVQEPDPAVRLVATGSSR